MVFYLFSEGLTISTTVYMILGRILLVPVRCARIRLATTAAITQKEQIH